MLVYSVVKASEILDSTGYKQAVCSTLCWALPYKPKSSTNPGSEAEALVPLWSSMLEEAAWSLLQLELQSLPQLPWQNLPEIEKQEGGNMCCFYVVWFFLFVSLKPGHESLNWTWHLSQCGSSHSSNIFSNKKSEGHFYNYKQQSEGFWCHGNQKNTS